MVPQDFYKRYQNLMTKNFPKASKSLTSDQLTHLISPFILELPKDIFHRAQSVIQTIYKISRKYPKENNFLQEQLKKFCPPQNKNSSILMAYDFHVVDNHLKLIEINTNGSGFILADLSRQAHDMDSSLSDLQCSFSEEIEANLTVKDESSHRASREISHPLTHSINENHPTNRGTNKTKSHDPTGYEFKTINHKKSVSIIDHNPQEQKMYVEFLMYKEWFQSWGIHAMIHDLQDLKWDGHQLLFENHSVDFIYNRYCDFYLEADISKDLLRAYKSGKTIFSPQPREYLLLADKQRLIDWSTPSFQAALSKDEKEILQKALIRSREVHSFENPDELWKLKKQLFFKPKNSYGSRSTYRGKSLTKKNFQRALEENFMVQDFTPPAQVSFHGSSPWKYDLRFYTFKDQIQLSAARIYRGQLTNFNELHGGFTTVRFV